jgi:hypothetical protein
MFSTVARIKGSKACRQGRVQKTGQVVAGHHRRGVVEGLVLGVDTHAVSADGGAQFLERREGGFVSLVEAVAAGQAGERRLHRGKALQGMKRGDLAAEFLASWGQTLAAQGSRAVRDEASAGEGAGSHELVARRFDGVVGHCEQDEVGATRGLARGENRHFSTDPARGLLGPAPIPSRDGGHAVAGTDREGAEGGPHLAHSDDGDRRPFAPLRHSRAVGSLLDLGSLAGDAAPRRPCDRHARRDGNTRE